MIKKILMFGLAWIFIPFVLVGFWIEASLFIRPEISFTSLRTEYGRSNFLNFRSTELYKGEKLSANFKAAENYLGTVAVRFNTLFRDNDDWLIFRIKEGGQKNWYYENKYKVDQFQPDDLFPFGFPIINDSANKTYNFEIESTKGKAGNSVAISTKSPVFIAKYQFNRLEISSGHKQITSFLLKKIINSFNNFNFFITSLVYLLPLFFYILLRFGTIYTPTTPKKDLTLNGHKRQPNFSLFHLIKVIKANLVSRRDGLLTSSPLLHPMFYIYGLILAFFILFNRQKNGYAEISLLIFGIYVLRFYRQSSQKSFGMALVILISAPFLYVFKLRNAAENAALWAYLFLVVGTVQAIWEMRHSKFNQPLV